MLINAANVAALFRGYRVQFMEAYQGAKPFWDQLAMRTPSTAAQELYHWLGAFPNMRELIGEIAIQNFSANEWTIQNKEWEVTVGVKRASVERDTYGLYNPTMQALGQSARNHPDVLTAALLTGGFATKDYTGKNFFDNNKVQDGVAGRTTLSNLFTDKLGPTSYQVARAALKGVKNSAGRPMGLGVKLLLVVPPALESQARAILQGDFIQQTAKNVAGSENVGASAVTNVNKGTAELAVWSQLAGNDNMWFLLETGMPLKPLIMQFERDPEFQSLTNPDSDHVFKQKEFLYQAYGRYNAGYGLPQLIVGSNGTTGTLGA